MITMMGWRLFVSASCIMHNDLYDFACKGVGSLQGIVIGFEGGLNKAYRWGVVQAWLCTFCTVDLTHLLTVVLLPLLEDLLLLLARSYSFSCLDSPSICGIYHVFCMKYFLSSPFLWLCSGFGRNS
jgi:hypothetical protein